MPCCCPRSDGPGDIHTVAEALDQADALDATEIWAMIETPKALLHLPAIAALADDPAVPLAAFLIGTNDLSLATRVPQSEDRAAFVPWFMQIVAAARAYGIDVIDGPLNAFRDLERLEKECRQGRALGMDGKTLIHPGQVETANRIFAPSSDEIEAARSRRRRLRAAGERRQGRGRA